MKDKLKDKTVKCRICNADHFTAKCPFKGTMAPLGEEGGATVDVAAGHADAPGPGGGLGSGKSSYVPPHLRNGAAGGGDRMSGGKFERDDLATLRVTNVSRIITVSLSITNSKYRSLKWPRNQNFGICSSVSVGLQECSWRRIEKLDWLKDLLSSVSKREQMLLRHATKWMVTGLST